MAGWSSPIIPIRVEWQLRDGDKAFGLCRQKWRFRKISNNIKINNFDRFLRFIANQQSASIELLPGGSVSTRVLSLSKRAMPTLARTALPNPSSPLHIDGISRQVDSLVVLVFLKQLVFWLGFRLRFDDDFRVEMYTKILSKARIYEK